MKVIAKAKTDFPAKFGVPRQSGLIPESKGRIVFKKEYSDISAVRGLEEFSHIWVLWGFSEVKDKEWSPTVRPPMLGGNTRVGVFATRSPYRPNPIGLSVLKLNSIETSKDGEIILNVSGCDMMDDTPVYDIKPYLPYVDSIPDAIGGFTENLHSCYLTVNIKKSLLKKIPEEKRELLLAVLKGDPRPRYHDDPERLYGLELSGFEIKFKVNEDVLTVSSVDEIKI